MPNIHPTAIIESGAQLEDDVEVGAYAYIGPDVTLKAGCKVHHHGVVEGATTLGENNQVFPFASIGGLTQDLKYKAGDKVGLLTGADCQFREYVTVHTATVEDHPTTLGHNVVVLAYGHIAHDCIIGNHVVLSSQTALGGHCIIGDAVNIAWGSAIHQFCRIGSYGMLAGMSKVTQDIPPFIIAEGLPADPRTINKIALKRNGYNDDDIMVARRIYKTMYRQGLNRSQALEALKSGNDKDHPLNQMMVEFVESSERGII